MGGLSRLAEFVRVDFFGFFSRGDDGDDLASGDEVKVLWAQTGEATH